MNRPRLEACYFSDPLTDGKWFRLARVLSHTAAQQCPGWSRRVQRITPAPHVSAMGKPSHVHNTQKMEHWFETVVGAPDGVRILLIDSDTMILRPLDDVWERSFDIAYTVKQSRFPFNSGVVFLRVSDRVRAFVTGWRDENVRMLDDRDYHAPWRKQYGGINQAALGHMLQRGDLSDLAILALPCREWNCEDSQWASFDPAVTRIVHIKSALREAAFRSPHAGNPPDVARLADIWRGLDAKANRAAYAAARAS